MSSRSKRARKTVNYSSFSAEFNESDDDFASSTPPPTKKSKLSTKNKAAKKEVTKKKSKNRREDDDFDEDLKVALELSMSDSSQNTTPFSEDVPDLKKGPSLDNDKVLETVVISDDDSAKNNVKERLHINVDDEKEEEVITPVKKACKARLTPGVKQKEADEFSPADSDSDFEASDKDEEDDDFNPDDDDSDYEIKKKKTPAKPKQVKNSSKPVTPKAVAGKRVKPSQVSAPLSMTSISSLSSPTSRLASKTSSSTRTGMSTFSTPPARPGLAGKQPKWTPPAVAGSSTTSCSSPAIGLRLGLSKNVKLKPLHSNFKPVTR